MTLPIIHTHGVMRTLIAVLIVAGAIATIACGDASSPPPSDSSVTVPAAIDPGVPDNTPLPRRVEFSAKQMIDTASEAGVVFVDPTTHEAEGWLLPGTPANYSLGVAATDGHLLLYRCSHASGVPPVAGCEGSSAWYLFDTHSLTRVRVDMFAGNTSPMVLGPQGDELLGVTDQGPALLNTRELDRPRAIAVPSGYTLAPWSASASPDGSEILVSAFQSGTPTCGYGPEPARHYACGATPVLWKALLIDRDTAAVNDLGNGTPTFAWSPDGDMFATIRSAGGLDALSTITMYAPDGSTLWFKTAYAFPNLAWSPDDSSLAVQVLSRPELVPDAMRLDVLDAATGETRLRIVGAVACDGQLWTADSARLILRGAYGLDGAVLADPRDGSLHRLARTLIPSSSDPGTGYAWPASGTLSAVSIDTGEATEVASFASGMALVREGGLIGGRLAFIAAQPGGRGGCAEQINGDVTPTTHFEYPPYPK
jgi:hypothetical protein